MLDITVKSFEALDLVILFALCETVALGVGYSIVVWKYPTKRAKLAAPRGYKRLLRRALVRGAGLSVIIVICVVVFGTQEVASDLIQFLALPAIGVTLGEFGARLANGRLELTTAHKTAVTIGLPAALGGAGMTLAVMSIGLS